MKYILSIFSMILALHSFAQNRILLDGEFGDWDNQAINYTDALGDGSNSGIDFGKLQIYNDEQFVFFSIEVGAEINFQDNNAITLFLDIDDDENTGTMINGIGAELVYTFGSRSGTSFLTGISQPVFHDDIGLFLAPTVSSTRFEIAIRRDASIQGEPLFPENTFRLVIKDNNSNGDVLPEASGGLEYAFSTDGVDPLPEYSIQKKNTTDLRVLSYNVLQDGIFDQSRLPSFTRVFQAIQPDIIGFTEIYDYSSSQVAARLETILPSSAGGQWYHAKEGPDCHAISRYPILASVMVPGYNANAGNGAFLIDLPDTAKDLLFIVAHPPCCTNDSGRQQEIDAIMAFVRNAKDGTGPFSLQEGSPIVIVGDMNLVGDQQQLETLLTGDIINEFAYGQDVVPDWDGSDLIDALPYTTHQPLSFTWYRPESSFSPGRLDFITYTGSNLLLQNAYSLFGPALPQDSLDAYDFFANDVTFASDHLPVVADFELKNLTSADHQEVENSVQGLQITPNPTRDVVTIDFQLTQSAIVHIQLMDLKGNLLLTFAEEKRNSGWNKIQLDISTLAAGVYVLNVSTPGIHVAEKVVLVK